MDKKRKIITCAVIILVSVLFCIGLFSAATCYVTAKVFDKTPSIGPVENIVPSQEATMTATAKVQDLFMTVMNPTPEKEKTLSLSGDEINALIVMAQTFQQFSGTQDPDKKVFVNFKDSKFTISFSNKVNFSTPFGSYINMRIVVIPVFSAKDSNIKLDSMKVGDITLSSGIVGSSEFGMLLNLALRLGGVDTKFTDTVKSISIDKDGNLVIVYNPASLQGLIKDKLNEKMSEIQQPSSGK